MKFYKGQQILEETVVYSPDTFSGTVEKLQAQSGVCYVTDSGKTSLEFSCTDKGDIFITNNVSRKSDYYHREYYVRGEVTEENGRTAVKIYSVREKANVAYRYFSIILDAVFLAVYFIIKAVIKAPLSYVDMAVVAVAVLFSVALGRSTANESSNGPADLEIMKNEVIKRVEAIKRWDE